MIFPWQNGLWRQFLEELASLPHALLLSGRSGIGTLDFARLVAKALLCEIQVAKPLPCGTCASCHWFAEDTHPDFRQLQPESHSLAEPEEEKAGQGGRTGSGAGRALITVDQVRSVSEFIGLTAHRQGKKVVVVNTAEELNTNAGNALLKSLEEPPAGTVFLLITHRPQRVLATIRSRCRIVKMPAPSTEEGLAWLTSHGQGIAEASLALREAGFAPFQALENGRAGYFERRKAFLEALTRRGFDPLTEAVSFGPTGVAEILNLLQKWVYDLAVAKSSGRIRYNTDFAEPLRQIAECVDSLQLTRFYRSLLKAQASLNHPLNSRLALEQMFIDYTRCVQSLPAYS